MQPPAPKKVEDVNIPWKSKAPPHEPDVLRGVLVAMQLAVAKATAALADGGHAAIPSKARNALNMEQGRGRASR